MSIIIHEVIATRSLSCLMNCPLLAMIVNIHNFCEWRLHSSNYWKLSFISWGRLFTNTVDFRSEVYLKVVCFCFLLSFCLSDWGICCFEFNYIIKGRITLGFSCCYKLHSSMCQQKFCVLRLGSNFHTSETDHHESRYQMLFHFSGCLEAGMCAMLPVPSMLLLYLLTP